MGHRAGAVEPQRRGYNHACLIAQTLDILGDRWTLLILRDLMAGLHRYNDILENCAGMSPNVLSDRLKRLEADGLVIRNYYKELPPRVEYTLTDMGWSVRPILQSLLEWGRNHVGGVTPDLIGQKLTADFVVRTLPALQFDASRAPGLAATMTIEISDCSDCNSWTYEIHDGHIHPRRHATDVADVSLKTDTAGFFAFVRGDRPAEECGDLAGAPETAAAIQRCFL